MTDEPVNMEEARATRAAELDLTMTPEEKVLREAEAAVRAEAAAEASDATEDGAEQKADKEPGDVEDMDNPLSLSIDEIVTAYGAMKLQQEKMLASYGNLQAKLAQYKSELRIRDNALKTKDATIKNLVKRVTKAEAAAK